MHPALTVFLRLLPYLLIAGLLVYTVNQIHSNGIEQGKRTVQMAWDKEKQNQANKIQEIKDKYSLLESEYRTKNQEITRELNESKHQHDKAITAMRSSYEHRLLLATQRASVYQRQAEAGTVECRGLADHATKLDNTLEEGRYLVRELRETLGFRDTQLILLGNQLMNDRKLLGE